MTVYGYARTSSILPWDQVKDLESSGCARVFADTAGGTETGPGWAALIETVERGDTVRVVAWDRLTRRADFARFVAENLEKLGVGLEALKP
ncbi:recombinase family protein [Saccharopolyspora hattusasensis]|uniref:recombinase family protein n=1 Tax=Saccharopolyspora hattusasensis TaxID=1128679 RepID=UPI003D9739ED